MDLEVFKHMTSYKSTFDMYEVITPHNVYLYDNSVVQAIGVGCIFEEAILEDKINQIYIKDVLHILKLQINLLLVNKLVSDGLKVQYNLNKCIVKSCNDEGTMNRTMRLQLVRNKLCERVESGSGQLTLELRHCHLSHLNVKGVHTFQNMMNGMFLGDFFCTHTRCFAKRASKANNIGLCFRMTGEDEQPNHWKSCITPVSLKVHISMCIFFGYYFLIFYYQFLK